MQKKQRRGSGKPRVVFPLRQHGCPCLLASADWELGVFAGSAPAETRGMPVEKPGQHQRMLLCGHPWVSASISGGQQRW